MSLDNSNNAQHNIYVYFIYNGCRTLKGLAKAHIYITHRHRLQRGDGQRKGGEEAPGWRWAKGGEWGHL